MIIASFCPQVFGLYVVKLCIYLALIGGVQDSLNFNYNDSLHVLVYLYALLCQG